MQAQLASRDSHMASLLAQHKVSIDGLTAERDNLTAAMLKQRETFKSQIKQMQEKLDNNLDGSSVATDDMSMDDSSTGSETITLATTECSSSAAGSSNRQAGRKGKGDHASIKKYKKRLRRVTKELTACYDQCEIKNAEISDVSKQLRAALTEVSACHRKMDALRDSNESLRYHMLSCSRSLCSKSAMGDQGDRGVRGGFDTFEDEVVIGHDKENSMRINALQHTPHFLHHRVHQAKMKSFKHV